MKIRLLQSIRHRSEELSAGAELDLPDGDATPLIAAKHAVAVDAPAKSATPTPKPTKE